MINAVHFLGNTEAPGTLSNVSANKEVEVAKTEAKPAQDTFEVSANKTEETPKADPNDKFEKKAE